MDGRFQTLPKAEVHVHLEGCFEIVDIVELAPARDINEISCIAAGHIIINFLGAAVRAGYFD